MQAHTYRIWVGASAPEQYAALMAEAGVNVTVIGTEHVHVQIAGADSERGRENLFALLRGQFGSGRASSMAFSSERLRSQDVNPELARDEEQSA